MGSIIKGTAKHVHPRDIPLEGRPAAVTGLDKASMAKLVAFLVARELEYLGPNGYRQNGNPGGWAWRIRIEEDWVAEIAHAHALIDGGDLDFFMARIDRLLTKRGAVETAYRLHGLKAIMPMLGELAW